MFSLTALTVLATTAVTQVAAHGGVLSYSWTNSWYWGWQPYDSPTGQTTIQRPWSSYNPITDATSTTLACNDDGTSGALQLTGTVAAGTPITAFWNQVWPHPYGPMLTYLANCGGSCTGVNANSLEWFKIDESGLLSGTVYDGSWGAGQMIAQNSSWTTTVPASVPAGNYLIRFETIALHSMPAQFYPECAQIQITGSGSLAPTAAELVKFPGAYTNNDPGLNIDIYSNEAQTETTYVIPGPACYAGAACASASSAPPVSAAPPPAKSTVSSVPTTVSTVHSTTAAAPTATGATAAQYAQCGGEGFTGPTVCAAPFTCKETNQYYSQCL
ncbi:cellulose-growth-specific protein [Schizopora paradoxa]|uniref:AA9 family lytic polysaccharide monooxygenase n=1 Tax=Schizopora paradoxa TaxID=27342 RepID=A0A0H2S1G8_9AGAM|nr:cellulose-growth-specific protein [Schizopora paradoxa]